ncbi:MAG: transposase, partial [bacterium]|nr:transposase [Candidatus Colousia faecequi]
MKQQEPLRFYDPKTLYTMAMEVLSSYLPGGKNAEHTRKILGLQPYQTQLYNLYTDSQLIKILKYCILTLVGLIENLARAIIEKDAYIQHLKAENERMLQEKDAYIKRLEFDKLSLQQENESLHKNFNEELQKYHSKLEEIRKELAKHIRSERKRIANSENSSLPPSQNPISEREKIKKNRVSLREESDKPNGGQPGHKGRTLKRMENVQEKILVYPDKEISADSEDTSDVICPNCGKPIPRSLFKEDTVRQLIDIIDKIDAQVKDYALMKATCPHCGIEVSGKFGPYTQGNVNYGPRLQALVTLLCVRHSVSINRTSELISDLYGIKLNDGTIVNMVQRQTEYSRGEWYSLRDDICDSNNGCNGAHADETHAGYLFIKNVKLENEKIETRQESSNSERIEDDVSQPPDKNESDSQVLDKTSNDRKIVSKQLWLWAFLNKNSVFIIQSTSRRTELMTEIFGDNLSSKILITDR